MTHTIHLTTHQAASLRHVIEQYQGMAARSPTVAALLDIDQEDMVRIQAILDTLPKPSKNGRYTAPLPSDVQSAYPPYRSHDSSTIHTTPSGAHADH